MVETAVAKDKTNNKSSGKTSAIKALIKGLKLSRKNTKAGMDPMDEVEFERRTASISDINGKMIFEQKDVLVPKAGP